MKKKVYLIFFVIVIVAITGLIIADLTEPDYTIEGDKVYIDHPKFYVSASPHTLRGSNWVVFNLTNKDYSGLVDVGLGFDTTQLSPKEIQRYSPHWQDKKYELYLSWKFFQLDTLTKSCMVL